MDRSQGVFSLGGVVQFYSWGGYEFIPALLNRQNAERQTYAEYWMGAHPNHPSIIDGAESLPTVIENDPVHFLGAETARKFGSLPYLLKVLDVRQMLSIQVHPDKVSAAKGYEDENQRGIALNASHRNYKDPNHKPELMAALGDFWLLHGFREEKKLKDILSRTKDLSFLVNIFEEGGYQSVYEYVMNLGQDEVNRILEPLLQKIIPLYEQGALSKDQEDFWAARAALTYCKNGQIDRGIFSIYLFNLVQLKDGEAVFQKEGLPHAYLEGQNVEIMANSDNVLRAGLTDKHIDVSELMKHVQFEATIPRILRPSSSSQTVYETTAEEFELIKYQLDNGREVFTSRSAEILLVMAGELAIKSGGQILEAKRGEAFFVLPGREIELEAETHAVIFRAAVPEKTNS